MERGEASGTKEGVAREREKGKKLSKRRAVVGTWRDAVKWEEEKKQKRVL